MYFNTNIQENIFTRDRYSVDSLKEYILVYTYTFWYA